MKKFVSDEVYETVIDIIATFKSLFLEKYCSSNNMNESEIQNWFLPVSIVRYKEGIPEEDEWLRTLNYQELYV